LGSVACSDAMKRPSICGFCLSSATRPLASSVWQAAGQCGEIWTNARAAC
jgi:hypothetical protein